MPFGEITQVLSGYTIAVAAGELDVARFKALVQELGQLAAAHPLREQFHVLRMLALYRCGRQADALAAYQQARRALVEEIGTGPGAGLREMHQRILTADPALTRTGGGADGRVGARAGRDGAAGAAGCGAAVHRPGPGAGRAGRACQSGRGGDGSDLGDRRHRGGG